MVVRKIFELSEHVDIELRTYFRNLLTRTVFLDMVQQVLIHQQSVIPNSDIAVLMGSNTAAAKVVLDSILALDMPSRQYNSPAVWKYLLTPSRSL